MLIRKLFKQEKKILIFLFLLSVALRALFFIGVLKQGKHSWIVFDSQQYHQVAQHIAQSKGVTNSDGTNNFYRLPGYPAFLALGYKLFDMNIARTLWIQVVLASILPLLIFLLSLTLFPSHLLLAKIAALFSAFHLGFVMYAGMLATEPLFLIFFLLFLILFYKSIKISAHQTSPRWLRPTSPDSSTLLRSKHSAHSELVEE